MAEFDVGFADLPNVILTPHIGAQTVDAQEEIGREVVAIFAARASAPGPSTGAPLTAGSHHEPG